MLIDWISSSDEICANNYNYFQFNLAVCRLLALMMSVSIHQLSLNSFCKESLALILCRLVLARRAQFFLSRSVKSAGSGAETSMLKPVVLTCTCPGSCWSFEQPVGVFFV